MPSDATAPGNFAANDRTDERSFHAVPNPLPLTLAGMLAALGPQAINFGISVGGGEAYLLPNISARGTLQMHWLMTISVISRDRPRLRVHQVQHRHGPLFLRRHQ